MPPARAPPRQRSSACPGTARTRRVSFGTDLSVPVEVASQGLPNLGNALDTSATMDSGGCPGSIPLEGHEAGAVHHGLHQPGLQARRESKLASQVLLDTFSRKMLTVDVSGSDLPEALGHVLRALYNKAGPPPAGSRQLCAEERDPWWARTEAEEGTTRPEEAVSKQERLARSMAHAAIQQERRLHRLQQESLQQAKKMLGSPGR